LPPVDDWTSQAPPVALAAPSVVFPESASGEGQLGWVDTEITVGAAGRVHDVWIVEAFPERQFESATIDGRATPVSLGVL